MVWRILWRRGRSGERWRSGEEGVVEGGEEGVVEGGGEGDVCIGRLTDGGDGGGEVIERGGMAVV